MTEEIIYPWGDTRRYNSYSGYFRKIFGGRVQKVTLNAGFTCPNRDGTLSTGGCTFCNNEAFTPSYCTPEKTIRRQIAEGMEFHAGRYRRATQYLAYFQSFSNTYAPLERLREIYDEALAVEGIAGLVIGTRPDCVDSEKLDFFAELARDRYVIIEYGVESCCDETLHAINRGHDFACAQRAIRATAERGIHVGAHFILGLPGETRRMMIDQAARINDLPLDTVKFHQLQIFRDTPMGRDCIAHPERYPLFGLDEYIDLFIDLLVKLRPDLVVERFAGEAPPRYHIGHRWGLIRNETLLKMLESRLNERNLWQGRALGDL
ncbi:MAG: TIGR01212 family radical SAM protein [Rikenellaceae bacterium]|jgi:radical SAM protein (TIGR01212 family)|nr:TIGR01212 family radical SAM protein [Rikenellaceae bacterium]